MQRYTYSVSAAFPFGKVNVARLNHEIGVALHVYPEAITVDVDDCFIDFAVALTAEFVAILDGVVATHSGKPLPYQFTVDADQTFPFHKVDLPRFKVEIEASAITVALDEPPRVVAGNCVIQFKAELSSAEATILEGLVEAHSGEPLPALPSKVVLTSASGDVAVEPDGRLVMVNFPADEGSFMWLTGCGDDVENGARGCGQRMKFTFANVTRTEPETQYVDLKFMEQVQLHDGQMTVTDPSQWDLDDVWNFGVHMAASDVTPNPTNTGNCNVVNDYVVVPAAGDGAFDVDLEVAVPVPGSGGYWAYDSFSDTLTVSPTPGAASWHLLLVDVEAYFMRNVAVPIHPAGNFDFDAYKAERIMPRWALRLAVTKTSNGPGKMSGWIVCFREQNT